MRFTSTCTKLAAIGLVLLLSACASGYSQFYTPAQGATPETIAAGRAAPPTGDPIVERTAPPSDAAKLLEAYAKRGYVLIGSSTFNSGRAESDSSAIEQGRKVGADLVLLLNPRYTGSTTTSVPLTTPTTTTSYSTGTATAYGPGGTVNAYGSGTTTTYGQQTTYIPITVNRMDYGAAYFVKQRWSLGVMWRDLTDAERQELQSNKGVAVQVVVDGTPAFAADILPGDLVLAVNGEPVMGRENIANTLKASAGHKVTLSLYRKGQHIEKVVQLN